MADDLKRIVLKFNIPVGPYKRGDTLMVGPGTEPFRLFRVAWAGKLNPDDQTQRLTLREMT